MAWQTDFLVEATAGLVGVFAGVILALWIDRRRQRHEEFRESDRLRQEFDDVRVSVLNSVVRNTLEAKRLRESLTSSKDPYLLGVNLELAVWEAAQSHFVRLAPLDDRVLLSRFFDHVKRLDRFADFYREAKADQRLAEAEGKMHDDISGRLGEVAEDIRLEGVIIVTDHGTEDQKRLLGLQ